MSKKSLALLLSVVLAIGGIAYGSVAYLTHRESLANVFTVGNVEVKVDETQVDKNGDPVDDQGNPITDPEEYIRKEEPNEYHLIPGEDYRKDPAMTVLRGSEPCYVRMLVTINNYNQLLAIFNDLTAEYPDGFLPQNHQLGWDPAKWICQPTPTVNAAENTITYEFRYATPVTAPANEDLKLEPLFETIIVPDAFTGEHLSTLVDFKVTVTGEAIQTAAFDTEDAAWEAFHQQNNK